MTTLELAKARGATLRAACDALVQGFRPEDIVEILCESLLDRARVLAAKKNFYRSGEIVDLVVKIRGEESEL